MQQCTLSLEDPFVQQLKQHADERGVSLSHVMRELLELGWQVKQASSSNQADPKDEWWQYALCWQLETRFLVRYLMGYMTSHDEAGQVINQIKDKAQTYVQGLTGQDPTSEST